MSNVSIDVLVDMVCQYDKGAEEVVYRAYEYAKYLHKGQYRQSGEPYIIHPLNVAMILAEIYADKDTICAALLHDTLEDTKATYDEIAANFNSEVAKLVDGVTKISKMNFSSKEEQNLANTRKIITSLRQDVRIIIIKLADRLHNMRTIQFKSVLKQKENALETLKIFVPLANYIGAYRMKGELEDISFRCLDYDNYCKIFEDVQKIEEENKLYMQEMFYKIHVILADAHIPNEIKVRIKNIYGIYKRLKEGHKLHNIHDLISFKIIVEEIDECYLALRRIHEQYKPVNGLFKDYICNAKPNYYQSLHTTVFAYDGKLVQMQIRTKDMDKVASFGLARYWYLSGDNARVVMQERLKSKYQFYSSLREIDKGFESDEDFLKQAERELFSDMVHVFTTKGKVLELPMGSTIVDFAYHISSHLGNTMVGAMVNDEAVDIGYVLKEGDRVKIISSEVSFGPRLYWEEKAVTTLARRRIRELNYSGKL